MLEVLTVHLTAARVVNDTTVGGASASDDRSVGGGVDYEFRRNVIVQAGASSTDSKFKGSGREDEFAGTHAGVKYLMNRYMSATAEYQYQRRDSNLPGQDFSDNIFGVTLHFQL